MLHPARVTSHALLLTLAIFGSPTSFAQTGLPAVTIPPVEFMSPANQLEARIYDLSEAIAAYVHDSDLPADEARKEALRQIFAPWATNEVPMGQHEISPGKFKVWATPSFHSRLPGVLEWMKNGRKQICIEARILTVTEETHTKLNAQFATQWEMSTVAEAGAGTSSVAMLPTAQSASPTALATFKKRANPSAEFISATTATFRSLPSRVARLTADQFQELINTVPAESRFSNVQAPKITIFPGQQATIKDTSQRPFVVGVNPVAGDEGSAMQPIIEVLEDGLTIVLRAALHGDNHLDLDSQITFNEIGDVDTFTFESDQPSQDNTVQIPEQHRQEVRVSQRIKDGTTLLIDPHFLTETTSKKRFGRSETNRRYTVVFLTPSILQDTPPRVISPGS